MLGTLDRPPLSAALSWQDRRNADWLARLEDRAQEVRRITGLVLSPHYGASKLRWCLDHLPDVRAAAARGDLACGPLASWLLRTLLANGDCVVDPANASRTLLFDPRTLDWSGPLLSAFGLERAWLPRCVPTLHGHGHLEVAGRRVPLTACTGDQSAAAWADGAPDPAVALVNAGTGAFVQRALGEAVAPPDGLLLSVLRAGPGGAVYSLEGTVNGAASAIAWLGERVAIDVARALGTLSAPAGTEVPVFMNGVGGLGSPWWRADFPVEFVGAGDERARLVAVVESIAFLLAANLEAMRSAAPLTRIRLTGGLANCDHLCRVLAGVTGLPVERGDDSEATARGTAYLAAGEPAGWRIAAFARRWLPEHDSALAERHRRWRREMSSRGAPA